MEVMFEVFIPKKIDLDKVGLKEIYNEWGGVKYPLTPAVYEWNDLVKFSRNDNASSYDKLLGRDVCLNDYYVFTLMDDSVSRLEFLINKGMDVSDSNMQLLFDNFLDEINEWVVLTLIDWDQFDDLYEVNDAKEAFALLQESLMWSNPKGIALVKSNME